MEQEGQCQVIPPATHAFLVDQYDGFILREPDVDGFSFWYDFLALDPSVEKCRQLQRYMYSHSYHNPDNLWFSTSDEEFIDSLYVASLGRPSDPGGKAWWLDQLSTHSRAELLEHWLADAPQSQVCANATAPLNWVE